MQLFDGSRRHPATKDRFRNAADNTSAGSDYGRVTNIRTTNQIGPSANPATVTDSYVINDPFSCSSGGVSDFMTPSLETDFWTNVAVVAKRNKAVPVDHEVLAQPAIPPGLEVPLYKDGTHYLRPLTQLEAGRIKQAALDLEIARIGSLEHAVHQEGTRVPTYSF